MLKIDSHQHFWVYDPIRDNWINDEMQVLRRNFLPADLKPLLEANGIAGTVSVQADQSDRESRFLLSLAEENDFIKAVVGWTDLCALNVEGVLEQYSRFNKLKGFRHILQAEEPDFMLKPDFLRGIAALKHYGFSYDILVYPHHLSKVFELVKRNPDQAFVLDHLAKPDIKNGEMQDWSRQIKLLALFPNVFCKLSGMLTEADHRSWKKEEIFPFLDLVVESFGPSRLMFGSDWPVCKLAADYGTVCSFLTDYLEAFTREEQEMIWAYNAIKFYKLDLN